MTHRHYFANRCFELVIIFDRRSKIRHFPDHSAIFFLEENAAGFDISMHDTLFMNVFESVADLFENG